MRKNSIGIKKDIERNPKDYVINNLSNHILALKKGRNKLRTLTFFFKMFVILLSTISTILLGLSIKQPTYIEWSRNIAFVIGAIVTLISGVLATFDIEKYWVKHKLMLYKLEELQNEYFFLQSREDGITEEEKKSIFYRHMDISKMKYEYWEKILEEKDDKKAIEKTK